MSGRPTETFAEAVRRVVGSLPSGTVAAYGEVAAEAGHPGAARAVGTVLRRSSGLPWWRVVAADGRLAPGLEAEQAARLRAEGVAVRDGHVVAPRIPGEDEAGRRPGAAILEDTRPTPEDGPCPTTRCPS